MSDRSQREIKAMIDWCRKRGAVEVKIGEIEVKFVEAEPEALRMIDGGRETTPTEDREEAAKRDKIRREALLYGSA